MIISKQLKASFKERVTGEKPLLLNKASIAINQK